MYKDNLPITAEGFMDEFMRLKRGSVSRRHFLGVTGLGLATAAVMARPGPLSIARLCAEDLGTQMSIATWPNYHDPATFETFQAGRPALPSRSTSSVRTRKCSPSCRPAAPAGRCSCRPTTRSRPTHKLGLIDELDLSKLPNFDAGDREAARFTNEGTIDGKTYAVPKNWGTTGFAVNTARSRRQSKPSWKDFFEIAHDRGRRPRHGARLPADHDRQCAGLARLLASIRSSPTNSPRPRNC